MLLKSKITISEKVSKWLKQTPQSVLTLTQDTVGLQEEKMDADMLTLQNVAKQQNAMTKDAFLDIPKNVDTVINVDMVKQIACINIQEVIEVTLKMLIIVMWTK